MIIKVSTYMYMYIYWQMEIEPLIVLIIKMLFYRIIIWTIVEIFNWYWWTKWKKRKRFDIIIIIFDIKGYTITTPSRNNW